MDFDYELIKWDNLAEIKKHQRQIGFDRHFVESIGIYALHIDLMHMAASTIENLTVEKDHYEAGSSDIPVTQALLDTNIEAFTAIDKKVRSMATGIEHYTGVDPFTLDKQELLDLQPKSEFPGRTIYEVFRKTEQRLL